MIGLLAAVAVSALPARPPEQRQVLLDLAYALGGAHALHRVCAGPADDFWRARMARLIGVERPDKGLGQALSERFNAGFVAESARHSACDEETRQAGRDATADGAALARRLTR